MGARKTKPAKIREDGAALRGSQGNQKMVLKRQTVVPRWRRREIYVVDGAWPDRFSTESNRQPAAAKRRKSLKELQQEAPHGFKQFESAVNWKSLDEDTALQLWEDIFKPLQSPYHFQGTCSLQTLKQGP